MTHPENCPERLDVGFVATPVMGCVRPPGHRGPHESATGVTWAWMTMWQRLRRFLTGRAT